MERGFGLCSFELRLGEVGASRELIVAMYAGVFIVLSI
jgi:hypothetical protein